MEIEVLDMEEKVDDACLKKFFVPCKIEMAKGERRPMVCVKVPNEVGQKIYALCTENGKVAAIGRLVTSKKNENFESWEKFTVHSCEPLSSQAEAK